MSISDKLTRLTAAHSAISSAITAVGGTVASGDGFEDFASDIGTIPQGGGGAVAIKDVTFFDYDGKTPLYSYTYAEAAALSALPDLPAHSGFTAQGWTHTLAQVQAAGTNENRLDVGATYVTADGATKFYVFTGAYTSLPTVRINLQMAANSSATIDWGDGTTGTISNSGSSAANLYAEKSDYAAVTEDTTFCIKISGGSFSLGNSSTTALSNNVVLKRVEIGNNCTGINSNAFNAVGALTSILIPQGVKDIGSYAFYNCYSLTSIVIPQGLLHLRDITFYNCYSLASVVIPQGVIISNTAFCSCYSLASVVIPQGVTTIDSYTFGECHSLSSVVIPGSVSNLASRAFVGCAALASIVFQQGTTTIGERAFQGCSSLMSVVIPNSIGNIQRDAFVNCTKLTAVDLSEYTSANQIPTLGNASAFPSTVQKFLVHDADMVTAFEAATNWSSYAGKYVVKGAA